MLLVSKGKKKKGKQNKTSANTKFRRRGWGGGAPCTTVEILQQPMEKTTVEQTPTLQPVEDPPGGYFLKELQPMETLH